MSESAYQSQTDLLGDSASLRESEELNRTIVEAMPGGIVRVDADGAIVHANAEAQRVLGVSYEHLTRQNVGDLAAATIHEDGRACSAGDYPAARCLKTGQPQSSVTLGVRQPDGQVRWAVFTAMPIPHPQTQGAGGAVITFIDITERKQAESALRQSQERFRLLAENVPGAIYLCRHDARWTMLFLNNAIEALTGYAKDLFLSDRLSYADLVHPDDKQMLRREIDRAVVEKHPFKLLYRIKHRDGHYRWIEETGVAVYGGEETLLEGYLSDVTDRIRAERALRQAHDSLERRVEERTAELRAANRRLQDQIIERHRAEEALAISERRLQAIIDGTNAVIYIKDLDGRYMLINRAFSESIVEGRDIMGKTDYDVFPAALADVFRHNDRQVIQSRQPLTVEEVATHPDGEHTYISAKFPLFDGQGELYAICGISTDITEHKHTLESLRLLQSAIEQVTDAVTITEPDLEYPGPRIVYVNRAFERMTGYKAEEVIGKSPRILQGPGTDRRVLDELRASLKSGKPARGEATNYRKDGTAFTLEWYISPIRDADGKIINWVAIQRDVTETRRIEKQARRHQAELAHVARLSTMGEMATGLAHELNQPLTAISNFSQGCLHRMKPGTLVTRETQAALQQVVAQAQRAGQIIRRMRSFVRSPDLHRTRADVNTLVREVVALCDNDLQHSNVVCTLELSDDLPPVVVDFIQIEQVVLNLVRNSIDAMVDQPCDARELTITTWADEQQRVHVRVQDTGAGLSPEVREHLFEPFQTTKAHGMGMGLAISRSIIESHGGRLTGASRQPHGAAFEFHLPTNTGEGDAQPMRG